MVKLKISLRFLTGHLIYAHIIYITNNNYERFSLDALFITIIILLQNVSNTVTVNIKVTFKLIWVFI